MTENMRAPLRLEEVELTQVERRRVLGLHQPRFTREVNTGELPPVPPIELEVPECIECGEPWQNGCSTVRAVLTCGVLADLLKSAELERDAAQKYCAEVGMRGGFEQIPSQYKVRVWAEMDQWAIEYGGRKAAEELCMKIFYETKRLFPKVFK